MPAATLQLLLGEGLTAAAVADALAAEVPVVAQRRTTIERVFWDTFDGRVRGAGMALVHARGRLSLVDATSLAERASEVLLKPGSTRLFARDLPPGALRDALEAVVEMRALTPVVHVKSRALPLNVLDEIGKIVVRLRVEEPTAIGIDGSRAAVAVRSRLHVAGVLGYDRPLADLRRLLERQLALTEQPEPVQDEAVRAVGGTVGGTSSKLKLALDPQERADAAAVRILRRLADVIALNLPGTLEDVDTEFLHDLRVAVRRTRALQRELRGVFAPEPLRAFRDGFRELQRVTGPVRDLDVQLLEFDALTAHLPADAGADVEPLRRLLQAHLRAERRAMVRALRADATRGLLDNWSAFLDLLVASDETPRPDAARPVGDVAGARIARVYRRMVKMGSAIGDDTPAEALHELRKQGKELRYLLEFFQSLYPAAVVKPMVTSLKGLQDVLGRFQDREVQAALLRSLGDEVAALDGGAPALMAMGLLVQRLGEEQTLARTQFAERFAAFAAKSQRKLVDQTFG